MAAPPKPIILTPEWKEKPIPLWQRVVVIPTIIAVLVIVFIVVMVVNDCPHQTNPTRNCVKLLKGMRRASFQPLSENPLFGPASHTLVDAGALQSEKTKHGEPWRLLSGMWLHAGVIHLVSNVMGLLYVGWRLELEYGPVHIGILYLLSGLAGNIFSGIFLAGGISVGSSGAIFGLLGASAAEILSNWSTYEHKVLTLLYVAFLIVINLIFGLMPFVDNFAHIGGLFAGFLLGFLLLVKPAWTPFMDLELELQEEGKKRLTPAQNALRWVAFAAILAFYAGGLALLFSDVDMHCSWCKYMSCVPTASWECPVGGISS